VWETSKALAAVERVAAGVEVVAVTALADLVVRAVQGATKAMGLKEEAAVASLAVEVVAEAV